MFKIKRNELSLETPAKDISNKILSSKKNTQIKSNNYKFDNL